MKTISLVEGSAIGNRTVPEHLIGCWRRETIAFPDGTIDRATRVIWLQTASGVADIRVSAERPDLRHRDGLAHCTKNELIALAEQDCFCAVTLFDPTTTPYPTAIWPTSLDLFRFQSVVSFPEPGWLEWNENRTVMIEYAPTGAYVEDWRLVENNPEFAVHLMRSDGDRFECLYVVGNHAVRARSRRRLITDRRLLPEIVRDLGDDLGPIRELLDCDFSYAQRDAGQQQFTVTLSTFPWLEGLQLNLDWALNIGPQQLVTSDSSGHIWKVDTLWSRTRVAH